MNAFLLFFSVICFVQPSLPVPTFHDLADLSKEVELEAQLSKNRSLFKNGSKQKLINDKATIRTLSIIHYKGTESRLVLLLCRNQCVRQRSLIPRWIREFMNESNVTRDDPIFFHYHLLKRPRLPVYSLEAKNPTIFYFVGGTSFTFNGDLSNKDHVTKWLSKRGSTKTQSVVEWTDLEAVLEENSGCSGASQLLIIRSDSDCPYDYWKNLARSLNSQTNLSLLEVQRPFNVELGIVLQQRFPKLSGDCFQMILISNDAYTELQILDDVDNMRESILSNMGRECEPPRLPWMPVDIPLSEIQLEYYSRDSLLRTNEMKLHFIVVGGIAGVSVVALAISIFWGLNGTAFTAQK
ncbi:hypothetical protein L596_003856 [Steinernema carpocapsae]|uniref:Uncharacterized protein n=1 Tax=Steinernema carpocapsae TaxID=34508 RepID=A0A4U8UU14_STECR|nr:hypothetical protein L596_003856 [Steinernema carpocapsae]